MLDLVVKKINSKIWWFFLLLTGLGLGWWLVRHDQSWAQNQIDYTHPDIPRASDNKLNLEAESYILVDVETNTIVIGKNIDKKVFPASITKLVTAMTALNIYPLDEKITVKQYGVGKTMGLVEADELTVADLVKGILVHSANDAAYNLAISHTGGEAGFVEEMNNLLVKNQINNSHLTNYDGIHNENHYSTAYDLAQIGRMAIKNPTIKKVAKLTNLTVVGSNKINYNLKTTNELLGKVVEIEGLKTGWTPEAGGCFLGLINWQGHKLISVVINSPDRFKETTKIVDWLKENVYWSKYHWDI